MKTHIAEFIERNLLIIALVIGSLASVLAYGSLESGFRKVESARTAAQQMARTVQISPFAINLNSKGEAEMHLPDQTIIFPSGHSFTKYIKSENWQHELKFAANCIGETVTFKLSMTKYTGLFSNYDSAECYNPTSYIIVQEELYKDVWYIR